MMFRVGDSVLVRWYSKSGQAVLGEIVADLNPKKPGKTWSVAVGTHARYACSSDMLTLSSPILELSRALDA